MKWFSAVVLTALALMASPVWAGCDLSQTGVPKSARSQLEAQCRQAEAELKVQEQLADANKLSAYAEVATQLAKAVGLAANELGVAVNDFIKTPAGILTIVVILVKVFGKLASLILVALLLNLVSFKLMKMMWRRDTGRTVETYGWFGWGKRTLPVRETISYHDASDGQVFCTGVLVVICFASLIVIPIFS